MRRDSCEPVSPKNVPLHSEKRGRRSHEGVYGPSDSFCDAEYMTEVFSYKSLREGPSEGGWLAPRPKAVPMADL